MGKSHSPKIFIFSYIYYNCECTDSVHNERIPALMALAGDKEKTMFKITAFSNMMEEIKEISYVETEEKAKKVCDYLNANAFLKHSDIIYEYEEEIQFPIIPEFIYIDAVVHKLSNNTLPWVEFAASKSKELKITLGETENRVEGLKVPVKSFSKIHRLESKVYEVLYRYQKGLDVEQ